MKYILPILLLFAVTFSSCGGDAEATAQNKEKTESKAKSKKADVPKKVSLIIGSNDLMKYDKKRLKVKEGQKVTLKLIHTGELRKEVMGHNWVLLQPDTDLAAFAQKALQAKENDYIPESDEIIAYTG
ncbi:MAG: plastocyanin/azurin family copper-binding protein, partial [Bacteroidota bacterium]